MDPSCGGLTSFSASVESLPEISVCDYGSRSGSNYFNLRRQTNTFKSEGNLLTARGKFFNDVKA